MIICNELIVLNFPKTGSTFVSTVVKDIYKKRYPRSIFRKVGFKLNIYKYPLKEFRLPNFQTPEPYLRKKLRNHGAYCQIPKEFLDADRKIISVVRNPYTRFLSLYQFRSWERYPPLEGKQLNEHFPNFPDLDLNEYIEMQNFINRESFDNKMKIGNQTIQFIRLFFKDPEKVLKQLDEDYVSSNTLFLKDMADIELLKTENLNEDLGNFLSNNNFTEKEVLFAKNYKKVNITKSNGHVKKENIWTKEALDHVKNTEWFLFKMLNILGIKYEIPIVI